MTRFGTTFRSVAALSTSFLAAGFAWGQHSPKVSHDTFEAAADSVPVIIQYDHDPGDAEGQTVEGRHHGRLARKLHGIAALSATMPKADLEALAKEPGVKYVSLDRPVIARGAPPAPVASIATDGEFTAEPINAPWAWNQGYTGLGIGVAVIDSGITPSADFALAGAGKLVSRIVYSQNFSTTGAFNDANDHFGHGTHVAGLIGGNGSKSTGPNNYRTFTGIAPNVNLINLRVLDETGMGSDSQTIAAIETAIQLKSTYNIRIINLSLGRPIWESYALDPLCQEVEKAWKAGIVVVVAAGNNGRNLALNAEGYGTIEAPGNDPYVLTVGAVRTDGTATTLDDAMASYSSKGPTFIDQVAKPDIVAPGNLVTSVLMQNSALQAAYPAFYTPLSFYQSKGPLTKASTDYMPLSGTSMATGVTSGAVALLLTTQPNLTPDGVKAFLMRDANKFVLPLTSTVTDAASGIVYTAHNDILTRGAGYLDINAAIVDAWANT